MSSMDVQPNGVIPYPGRTDQVDPRPRDSMRDYVGSGLLDGKRALVTGGDSGIGRAVAVAFAKEGADVAIAYLDELDDAEETLSLIDAAGRKGAQFAGDLAEPEHCRTVVADAANALGGLDIPGQQRSVSGTRPDLTELSDEQWRRTFAVNIDGYFTSPKRRYRTSPPVARSSIPPDQRASRQQDADRLLGHQRGGDRPDLFLAQALRDRGIRVNCVAPGPVWTPLIPATMGADKVESFGEQAPWAEPPSPTRSPCRMSFSLPANVRRITAERCSRQSVARHYPAEKRRSRKCQPTLANAHATIPRRPNLPPSQLDSRIGDAPGAPQRY